jgi:muramidase (phage lysozyme)
VDPVYSGKQPPLVMKGGDPYIRALMRTISVSEANSNRPYSLLYSGQQFSDFSHHPEICITIVNGPNQGSCSTAAGRYQIINKTWFEIAPLYHPHPTKLILWTNYTFAPEDQDIVVYRWLNDSRFWGKNISHLLHQGKLQEVLQLLSPTWTSLGYGIETNTNTKYLPHVYQKILQEELPIQQKSCQGKKACIFLTNTKGFSQ